VRDAKRVHAFQIGVRTRSLDRSGRGRLAGAAPLEPAFPSVAMREQRKPVLTDPAGVARRR
jgi:hypothetical protein